MTVTHSFLFSANGRAQFTSMKRASGLNNYRRVLILSMCIVREAHTYFLLSRVRFLHIRVCFTVDYECAFGNDRSARDHSHGGHSTFAQSLPGDRDSCAIDGGESWVYFGIKDY